jgi:subtilisin family serine protease
MDGNTTIVTIGADIAAGHGILIVNSAGNAGLVAEPANTLIGPADGDSVLAVGAVDGTGTRVSFSSVGPTADSRIKPDVMAMGASVRVASPSNPSAYYYSSGTSFSCPLTAGAAALLLEANPSLTNMQIIDALRSTASQSGSPDRLMGYGIVDAAAAAAMTATGVAVTPRAGDGAVLYPAFPNPFNPTTTIRYDLTRGGRVSLTVYDVLGRRVARLVDERQEAGPHAAVWDGAGDAGERVASGVYVYRLVAGDVERSRKMVLLK